MNQNERDGADGRKRDHGGDGDGLQWTFLDRFISIGQVAMVKFVRPTARATPMMGQTGRSRSLEIVIENQLKGADRRLQHYR